MDIITYALSKKGIIKIDGSEYKPAAIGENGQIIYKKLPEYTTFTFRGSESATYSTRNTGMLVMINNVPNSITELYVNNVPQQIPQISLQEIFFEDFEDDFTSLVSTLQVSEGDVIKVKGGFSLAGNEFFGNIINISDIKIQGDLTNCFGMFFGCTSLTEAPVIPNSVTNCDTMFAGCESLTQAPVIPNSVTNCESMFNGCTSLTEAPVIPNSVTNCDTMFASCESLTEAPVIPSSVTNCNHMFEFCTSLTKAPVISDGVTNCESMFDYCTSLTEAPAIPNSVTNCNCMFDRCTSLTVAPVIQVSAASCYGMFRGCTSLTEAPVIPSSVINCRSMFEGCTNLAVIPQENIDLMNNPPEKLDYTDCYRGCPLVADYILPSWGGKLGEYTIFTVGESGTLNIANVSSGSITELYIDNVAQELPTGKKYNSTSAYTVENGQKIKIKGSFSLNRTKLPIIDVILQNDLTNCEYMFIYCDGLTTAPVIPSSVKNCARMFQYCEELIEPPVIPNGINNCEQMFNGCSKLIKSPVIPSSVTKCSSMFTSCTSLTEVQTISEGITDCSYMFSYCTSLTQAPVIPNSVKNCTSMFGSCNSLTQAPVIPNSVTNCSYMFNGCSNLSVIPQENIDLMNNPREGLTYTDCYKGCPLVADIVLVSWGGNKVEEIPGLYTTFTVGEAGTLKVANVSSGSIKELYIDDVAQQLPTGTNTAYTSAYTVKNGQKIKIKGSFSLIRTTLIIEDIVLQNDLVSCNGMFDHCIGLTVAPAIPQSAVNCSYMFNSCTGLTEAPVIPSSVTNCNGMFSGCTSLTKAPVIPSSVNNCSMMFGSCTSLTTLPEENVDLMNNPPEGLIYEACYIECKSIVKPITYDQIPNGWKSI